MARYDQERMRVAKTRGFASPSIRLGAVIGVFAFLLVGTAGVTYCIARAQKADASVINLAGRQRMLTQKFLKERNKEE